MKNSKKIIIITTIIIFSSIIKLHSKNITLTDAINQNLVSVKFKGADSKSENYKSSYWGNCVELSITNKTNKMLSIEVEPGLFLSSNDSSIQKMMIIDNSLFMLAKLSSQSKNIAAVCSQMHYTPPSQLMAFNLNGKAEGDLLLLAKLIAKNKINDFLAQNAVWVLTDGNSIESVFSHNKLETQILQNFLSKVKKIPLNNIKQPTHIDRKKTTGEFILKINNANGGKYTIVLYDSLGVEIETFQKDKEYPIADLVKIKYYFESTLLAGIYYIRMTRNSNELIHNKVVIVK